MYYTSTSYVLLWKSICNGSRAENVRQRFGLYYKVTSQIFLHTLIVGDAISENWPYSEFILKRNRGQYIYRVTANCCQLLLLLAR